MALDEALNALARIDPRKAQIVELRFFGGLSVEEIAEVLQVSTITVIRDWSAAKAWLYQELPRRAAMDAERWNHVERCFQSALDLPPDEHDAFLKRSCAGDDALERDIRSLLDAAGAAGTFLSGPAIDVAATRTGPPPVR